MKKLSSFIVAAVLILSITLSVSASPPEYVRDKAGLLSSYETDQLNDRVWDICDSYDLSLYIITLADLDTQSAESYAVDFYDCYLSGNAIVFVISMQEREWTFQTFDDATSVVTDSEIDTIMDSVVPHLSAGQYYQALDELVSGIEDEYESEESAPLFQFLFALLIGAAAGGITLLVMRGTMKTAKEQHGAENYMIESSYDLFQCRDIFLYSRTTKVRKPDNNSSGGRSSGGSGSRGGRSGRF